MNKMITNNQIAQILGKFAFSMTSRCQFRRTGDYENTKPIFNLNL